MKGSFKYFMILNLKDLYVYIINDIRFQLLFYKLFFFNQVYPIKIKEIL